MNNRTRVILGVGLILGVVTLAIVAIIVANIQPSKPTPSIDSQVVYPAPGLSFTNNNALVSGIIYPPPSNGDVTPTSIAFSRNADTSTAMSETLTLDDVQRISQVDAKAAFDGQKAVFIDVRSTGSYHSMHIPGAISVPETDIPARLDRLDPQQWIITYCSWSSDQASVRAALILMQNGFKHVNALQGGFSGWVALDYPTEP